MKMIKGITCVALGLSLAASPLSVAAQAAEKGKVEKPAKPAKKTLPKKPVLRKGGYGGVFNQPVYNPATKSYFELVGGKIPLRWWYARLAARRRVWKGVHGRLAVVKNRQVHDFLRRTFRSPFQAWIGLRYMCSFNTLIWVTGEIQKRSAFSYWARVWNRYVPRRPGDGKPMCGGTRGYWPVDYYPVASGFQWHANGMNKVFRSFFVEYPTGKR